MPKKIRHYSCKMQVKRIGKDIKIQERSLFISDLTYAIEDAASVCRDTGLEYGYPLSGPKPGPQFPRKNWPELL